MSAEPNAEAHEFRGFQNAADVGFLPGAEPAANVAALQRACDGGNRTVIVSRPGEYLLDGTVYVDSNTRLLFGEGVILKKTGRYSFVLINRGVLTRTWNENISVDGLQISVNDVDCIPPVGDPCFGLRGHLSLFRVRNGSVTRFRCLDLARGQFTIHVCAFENLLIDGFEIRGMKDGIHIGCGRMFAIRNGVCQTFDDAIALNAQDYPSSQPMQGDIEDGLIEHVTDVAKDATSGNFARLLTGAWVDWYEGIRLQHGDTVRHRNNVYRISMQLGTTEYVSRVPPVHTEGAWADPEGLTFVHNQSDGATRASIRNVTFANVFLRDRRTGFSARWESGRYHRAVHPETPAEGLPECSVRLVDVHGLESTVLVACNSHLRAWLDRVCCRGSLLTGGGDNVRWDVVVSGADLTANRDGSTPDIAFNGAGTVNLILGAVMQDRDMRLSIDPAARSCISGNAAVADPQ